MSNKLNLTELKFEYSVNPLGIDTIEPRFLWLLKSEDRGMTQSAYRILVASSKEKLNADTGNNWDSGRVESDNSVNHYCPVKSSL